MRLILPVILLVLGAATGVGAGYFFMPSVSEPEEAVCSCDDPLALAALPMPSRSDPAAQGEREYVALDNQFIVPVVEEGRVSALVVLSLNVEVALGAGDLVLAHEPRLRDIFLQMMFDHANIGGFQGAFTSGEQMDNLRRSLRAAGRQALGEQIIDVLITDIVRQDM